MSIYTAHVKAVAAATVAADKMMAENGDGYPAGFAWVQAKVDGRSKIAKELKKIGFTKGATGALQLWNPAGSFVQNLYIKAAGAEAYVDMMRELTGIETLYVETRWD